MAAGTTGGEPPSDPGGAQAAVDRHRDIAKWIITVFAAVAGLLAAGTQLSSLGQLDLHDDGPRLAFAAASLGVALASALVAISAALSVLRPIEMSLEEIVADPVITAELDRRPSLLPFDASSVAEMEATYRLATEDPFATPEDLAAYAAQLQPVVDHSAYLRSQGRFEKAWRSMAVAAVIGALAILVFAYAANPEKPDKPDPAPVVVTVTSAPASERGPRGPRGFRGPSGRSVPDPAQVRAVLAAPVFHARSGRPVRIRFATTRVGVATLVVERRGRTVSRTVEGAAIGTNGIDLVVAPAGHYVLRLHYRAAGGTTTTDVAAIAVR